MKTIKYTRVSSSGEIETLRVPLIIKHEEVSRRLPEDLVFMQITKASAFYTADGGLVEGPASFCISKDGQMHKISEIPKSLNEAREMTKNIPLATTADPNKAKGEDAAKEVPTGPTDAPKGRPATKKG